MNKRIFLTCAAMALMSYSVNAQSRLSANAKMLIANQHTTPTIGQQRLKADKNVLTTILLEEGSQLADETLAQYGVQVIKRLPTMVIAYVPMSQLAPLSEAEGIRQVDTGGQKRLFNDRSRQASSVTAVHDMNVVNSMADVPVQYRGQGVLVAIIDNEIDLAHPAFRNADGSTRIKQAMEFEVDYETEELYYNIYDEEHIDEAIQDTKDREVEVGHGTHVASIAAGSTAVLPDGHPMKDYYGMAPEADLLLYDVPLISGEADVFLALTNAFDMADQLHRPLVVNMSVGTLSACLDASDPFNTRLQALVDAYDMSGKIICISAANSGHTPITVQLDCDKPIVDNDWTAQHSMAFISQNIAQPKDADGDDEGSEDAEESVIYLNDAALEFYSHDDHTPAVKIDVFDKATHEKVLSIPMLTSEQYEQAESRWDFNDAGADIECKANTIYGAELTANNRTILRCDISINSAVPVYMIATLYTKDEGMQVDGCITNGANFAELEGCVSGNNWGTLNMWATSDNVITVGSYNTRQEFVDLLGKVGQTNDEGDISYFSSYRHPHYGTPKPEITAPGSLILSAYHHNVAWESVAVAYTMMYDGTEHLWGYMQGTSMSSPATTGIVALWLQANPMLTRDDVVDIMAQTSDYDAYCEADPLRFGLGKINAKRGIDLILSNTVCITSVGNDADAKASKYIDAAGRIMIRKGSHDYDIMGVETK